MNLLDLLQEKFTDMSPQVGSQGLRKGPPTRKGAFGVSDQSLSPNDVVNKWFVQHGWNIISTGHWSRVYENPAQPNWVLKVMPGRDRGYMRFWSIAKNSNNIHFPEVGKMGVMDIPGGQSVYCVMIEKLSPTCYDKPLQKLLFRNLYSRQKDEAVAEQWPTWYDAFLEIYKVLRKTNSQDGRYWYQNDLGGQNIMWRGNIPVIIDPIYGDVR